MNQSDGLNGNVALKSDCLATTRIKNCGSSRIVLEGNCPEYGCNTSPTFGAVLRGNGKLLVLGSNLVHFWLCYNRWNDGILFYQDLEEREHNSANQKTKNDFLEIW